MHRFSIHINMEEFMDFKKVINKINNALNTSISFLCFCGLNDNPKEINNYLELYNILSFYETIKFNIVSILIYLIFIIL
jgi:hypothetical protein